MTWIAWRYLYAGGVLGRLVTTLARRRRTVFAVLAFAVIAVAAAGCGGGGPVGETLLPAPKTAEDAQKFRELPPSEYREYMEAR